MDLGVPSTNLEKIPTKQQRKDSEYMLAIQNLTMSEPPDRLSRVRLPNNLLKI